MTKIVATLILSSVLTVSFSQVTKTFFDRKGEETDSVNSYYFIKSTKLSSTKSKDESFYYNSGILRHKEDSVGEKGSSIKTYFYPNGKIKSKGYFFYSTPRGKFTSYYENGSKQGEFVFLESMQSVPGIQIINYWDSLGNTIVESGKGNCNHCWLEPYEDLITLESGIVEDGFRTGLWRGELKSEDISFEEMYKNGKLVSGTQKNKGQSYKYIDIVETAGPKNGMNGLSRHISNNVKYPKAARKSRIEGTVFVAFVVGEDGVLRNFKVVKGIHQECDDEALKAVSTLPKFNNGTYRGKPVKMRMVLPVKFKLS